MSIKTRIIYATITGRGSLCSVVANVLDCDKVESEFEFQSGYYVHFRTNTFRKGMKSLISPVRS